MKKVLLTAILMFSAVSAANAQVALEGSASYRISGYASRLSANGYVTRVANYNYHPINGARVILGLSKNSYSPGRSLSGTTIATSAVNDMQSRTYYENVQFSGVSNMRVKGLFNVVLLVLDGSSNIKAGLNFKKKVSVGQASFRRLLKRSAQTKDLSGSELAIEASNSEENGHWN